VAFENETYILNLTNYTRHWNLVGRCLHNRLLSAWEMRLPPTKSFGCALRRALYSEL
jgi:hypothetical protein